MDIPEGLKLAFNEEATSRQCSQTFDFDLESIGAARAFAREVVSGWNRASDAVETVVGELASNAVLHGRSAFQVNIGEQGELLRLEVSDDNSRLPVRSPIEIGALSGRGLNIIKHLSLSWGCDALPGGKTVWAVVSGEISHAAPSAGTHTTGAPPRDS
jgi:anti-sigma regulatory factor (Ser/Thr protein kinase)